RRAVQAWCRGRAGRSTPRPRPHPRDAHPDRPPAAGKGGRSMSVVSDLISGLQGVMTLTKEVENLGKDIGDVSARLGGLSTRLTDMHVAFRERLTRLEERSENLGRNAIR